MKLAVLVLALLLGACASIDQRARDEQCARGPVAIHADHAVAAGKSAGAVIAGCAVQLASIRWTQLDGPKVALLSARTQAISFDVPAPARYRFRAAYVTADGTRGSAEAVIDGVAAATGARITARADQAVREGGTLSLQAYASVPAGDAIEAIRWTQIAGPAVKIDGARARLFVVAPAVERDTVLAFRVSLTTKAGATDSDDVFVVVEDFAQAAERFTVFGRIHVARAHPYWRDGKYADALVPCAYDPRLYFRNASDSTLCALERLPFLAQETGGAPPTVEAIMGRLVVSHDWIGTVFEEFIRVHPAADDLRRMFGAVTAIVITNRTRPSIYNPMTGAIYLDATHLWRTPAERDTVDETPDRRAVSAAKVRFRHFSRYVESNKAYATGSYPIERRLTRTQAHLMVNLSRLVFHELAHANDYLPPDAVPALAPERSVHENFAVRVRGRLLVSDQLQERYPLHSDEFRRLARVIFSPAGASPDAAQAGMTAEEVARFFASDRANDPYAYTTSREDAAMLVEEFFMVHRFGIRRDVAIVDGYPAGADITRINASPVRWGQRGRIGAEEVKPRLRFVLERMLPWIPLTAVDSLAPPVEMRAGESWIGNLVLP